ncbi:hypothetical protein, partial [Aeromonas salmonicida]|uniref:hypothetical protein n=1 Tax=Aeromonas salmonicida TaxID=645 RepID=UPI003D1AB994
AGFLPSLLTGTIGGQKTSILRTQPSPACGAEWQPMWVTLPQQATNTLIGWNMIPAVFLSAAF